MSNDPVKIKVHGSVNVTSSIVLEHRGPDGTLKGVRTADRIQSAGADHSAGASPAFTLSGRNRHETEGEVDACSTYLEYLAQMGHGYSGLRKDDDGDHPGVDRIAESPDGQIKMQVTRAARGDFRPRLADAPDRQVSHSYVDADEAADAIRDAIADKFKTLVEQRGLLVSDVVLILDSRETLALIVNPDVVPSFRRRNGAWTSGLGFQSVWLVGPTAAYVFRLDG
jgi:hypothetical protein